MTEEKRLVTRQDIQMVASAVLKQHNEAGDRLVGAKVKEGRDDFYEIQMIFAPNYMRKVCQKIIVDLIERGKPLMYADHCVRMQSKDDYNLNFLEISPSKMNPGMDFALMAFEK